MKKKQPQTPLPVKDVRDLFTDILSIISAQVELLKRKAQKGKQLNPMDSRLLSCYTKDLCLISDDQRRSAILTAKGLGKLDISDSELEALEAEAREVLSQQKSGNK